MGQDSRTGFEQVLEVAPGSGPVLALGAEVNSTVCLVKDGRAYVSPPLGNLEDYRNFLRFEAYIREAKERLGVEPEIIAHDLHPEYLSTKYALEQAGGARRLGVQHHHAHLAACLLDHGLAEPVIGVTFDGTGYGSDGCLWGGEFMTGSFTGFHRWAHLAYLPLPSGSQAIKEPWRMGAQYLYETFGEEMLSLPLAFVTTMPESWQLLNRATRQGINAPLTSSCGRLFDGVAAVVLGFYRRVNFEGEAAIQLERTAAPEEEGEYPFAVRGEMPWQVDWRPLWQALVEDLGQGVAKEIASARFHNTVARIIQAVAMRISRETGLKKVALGGGVFQNRLLVQRAATLLTGAGLEVLPPRRLSPGDRSLSLGQAMIALAKE